MRHPGVLRFDGALHSLRDNARLKRVRRRHESPTNWSCRADDDGGLVGQFDLCAANDGGLRRAGALQDAARLLCRECVTQRGRECDDVGCVKSGCQAQSQPARPLRDGRWSDRGD